MAEKLSYEQYKDKVLAGWIGKSLGGVIGAPLENHKFYHDLTADRLWPEEVGSNDDLDIQIVWLEAMQERGVFLTSRDLAEFWQDRCFYNFLDYGVFLYNLQRGIAPPLSGTWNNHFFWESEGCPIRSEIWGFVSPGNPQLAGELARLDGQLDHGGASVQIEMFNAATAARAFISGDLDDIIAAGLSVLPADSRLPDIVAKVRSVCEEYPEPFKAWRLIIREYGDRDASKAVTNFAIALMSLFLGKGDFKKTMLLLANGGWDTDCTAATACALLGVMLGTKELPADWVEKLDKKLISALHVRHKDALLTDFTEDTCRVGVEMAALRNPLIELTNAPKVTIRPAPKPAIEIEVDYPHDPVLWAAKPTPVRLIVKNPLNTESSGTLQIATPSGIRCDLNDAKIRVPSAGQKELTVNFFRENPKDWLADKNLFEARWIETGRDKATRSFGLGGAHQWQVYGPYWDAWDRTKDSVCPFFNDKKKSHPNQVGLGSVSYNHFAQLDYAYLDESLLTRKDIPDELPLCLETGTDLITEKDLGGFKGQACYYFVRTVKAVAPLGNFSLAFGRTGPVKVWFDGKEMGTRGGVRPWCPVEFGEEFGVNLNGKPQRLVVKFLRLTDALAFSMTVLGTGDPEQKRGISWQHDGLQDFPVK